MSASDKKPYSKIETITPERAYEILEKNPNVNRTLNEFRVKSTAQDILSGNYKLTHQGIAFDPDDNLIDGQHRLWACVMANKPIQSWVFYNTDPATLAVIDSGRPRTVADNFKMLFGVNENKRVAATLNLIQKLVTGHYPHLSTMQAVEVYKRFQEGIDWAIETLKNSPYGKTASYAALALAYKTDPKAVKSFAEKFKSGVGLAEGDPALAARNFLINRLPTVRQEASQVALKILRALHCHMEGLKVTKLYESQGKDALVLFAKAYGISFEASTQERFALTVSAPSKGDTKSGDLKFEVVRRKAGTPAPLPRGLAKAVAANFKG